MNYSLPTIIRSISRLIKQPLTHIWRWNEKSKVLVSLRGRILAEMSTIKSTIRKWYVNILYRGKTCREEALLFSSQKLWQGFPSISWNCFEKWARVTWTGGHTGYLWNKMAWVPSQSATTSMNLLCLLWQEEAHYSGTSFCVLSTTLDSGKLRILSHKVEAQVCVARPILHVIGTTLRGSVKTDGRISRKKVRWYFYLETRGRHSAKTVGKLMNY